MDTKNINSAFDDIKDDHGILSINSNNTECDISYYTKDNM